MCEYIFIFVICVYVLTYTQRSVYVCLHNVYIYSYIDMYVCVYAIYVFMYNLFPSSKDFNLLFTIFRYHMGMDVSHSVYLYVA